MFFIAFLPQFVSLDTGNLTLGLSILGTLFVLIALVADVMYVMMSGKIRALLARNVKTVRAMKKLSSATYILLGLMAATGDMHRR